MTEPTGVAAVIPDRRSVIGGPNTHRTLIIVGLVLQGASMFTVDWIDGYRAGLMSIATGLLLLGDWKTALGRREGDLT
jgi:hypothetical protein